MIPPPGYGEDLDTLVQNAIAAETPNTIVPRWQGDPENGTPLLAVVCIQKRLDLAKQLLDAGATLSADEFAHVVWWWADAEAVTLLLTYKVPYNEWCLNATITHERWESLIAFLDAGASVQTLIPAERTTATMLHAVAYAGVEHMVRELIRRGAMVDALDSEGFTPLMKACHFRAKQGNELRNSDTVFRLLQAGANPNLPCPDGGRPCCFAYTYL